MKSGKSWAAVVTTATVGELARMGLAALDFAAEAALNGQTAAQARYVKRAADCTAEIEQRHAVDDAAFRKQLQALGET